jgi:mitochondrial distribution and morphology protein 12
MSVDIEWATITSGADGEVLAEKVRAFIHDKFQQITLPRFISSVHVHSFSFGDVCPDIEIKDICDPLPDFYEDDESEPEQAETQTNQEAGKTNQFSNKVDQDHLRRLQEQILHGQGELMHIHPSHLPDSQPFSSKSPFPRDTKAGPHYGLIDHLGGHFPRSGTPGIPGGTSNLSNFHLPISGLSGTQTPLAAVASGTPFPPVGWHNDQYEQIGFSNNHVAFAASSQRPDIDGRDGLVSTPRTRPSTTDSVPSSPGLGPPFSPKPPEIPPLAYNLAGEASGDRRMEQNSSRPPLRIHPSQPSDLQVVARVKYSGNIRMMLTAEILLDYPMPSFVGIPLKLSITGMTFDGVAILAYIRKRMHFCFLGPEDADALVGDQIAEGGKDSKRHKERTTGLLREIHVESEIGRQENGKQVLKNVGKVEKFVLEQVRRIFEEEFVFPSYYTFLV